jgi:hypothetical protein
MEYKNRRGARRGRRRNRRMRRWKCSTKKIKVIEE